MVHAAPDNPRDEPTPDRARPGISDLTKAAGDLRGVKTLERLRREYPGWLFEDGTDTSIPWTARRRRTSAWHGGHGVCEAEDSDTLEWLLERAVRVDTQDEGPSGSQGPSDADAVVREEELHQFRDESRATVSDRTLRRLASDADDPDEP